MRYAQADANTTLRGVRGAWVKEQGRGHRRRPMVAANFVTFILDDSTACPSEWDCTRPVAHTPGGY